MLSLQLKKSVDALRLPHLVKNLLLFLPLLLAHRYDEIGLWKNGLIGFIVFSIGSSGIYLFNDVCDLEFDQQHPGKQSRIIVRGELSKRNALWIGLTLMSLALLLSITLLPRFFSASILIYIVLAVSYSLYLKRLLVIDVLLLSSLYTLRLFAGAALANVELSYWLLAFSLFFFTSLALAKRLAELLQIKNADLAQIPGRAYKVNDEGILRLMGFGSAIAALVLYSLYILNPAITSLYQKPALLWISCYALLYWITRLWILVRRGKLAKDPITWALRDRNSYITLLIMIGSFYLAI
jgi:4-hydroxybenzoate polyprenyltransferase